MPSTSATPILPPEGAFPSVDGEVDSRKTCKIRAGQAVGFGDVRIRVIAAA